MSRNKKKKNLNSCKVKNKVGKKFKTGKRISSARHTHGPFVPKVETINFFAVTRLQANFCVILHSYTPPTRVRTALHFFFI